MCPSTDGGTGGLTVDPRHGLSRSVANGVCSHDDVAQAIRRTICPETGHIGPSGWSSRDPEPPRPSCTRRAARVHPCIPLVLGLLGASVSPQPAHGDDLSDAKARQAALKKEVAA